MRYATHNTANDFFVGRIFFHDGKRLLRVESEPCFSTSGATMNYRGARAEALQFSRRYREYNNG